MQESAAGVLAATLVEARDALPDGAERTRDLIDELLEHLAGPAHPPLADTLLAFAGADEERRTLLADVIGLAARRLAPDDEPPADGAAEAAWRGLVGAVDGLYGSGVAALGRLPFVGDRLLELLGQEARLQLEQGEGRRAVGEAGRVLASLAVSGKLREAVAAGIGVDVVPTYNAVYLYERAGVARARTHVDARDYEVVFHLVLDHELPGGSGGSALVAHLPAGTERLAGAPRRGRRAARPRDDPLLGAAARRRAAHADRDRLRASAARLGCAPCSEARPRHRRRRVHLVELHPPPARGDAVRGRLARRAHLRGEPREPRRRDVARAALVRPRRHPRRGARARRGRARWT